MNQRTSRIGVVAWVWMIFLYGCQGTTVKGETDQRKHWVDISQKGTGRLYLDPVPAERVMKVTDTGSTRFICYQVGFREQSIVTDKTRLEGMGKYFQYTMQKDWILKVKTDSLIPVFFQPSVKMDRSIYEGILVFEIEKGQEPDTLIYRDSFGPWGIQKIILNRH